MEYLGAATINLVALVRAAVQTAPPHTAGALVALLAAQKDLTRAQTLGLLLLADAFASLESPEFVDGLGERRPKTKQLIRAALELTPGAAVRCILAMNSSGALNLIDSAAMAELHTAITAWGGDDAIPAVVMLLRGVLGDTDTFAQAGALLAMFVDSRECTLSTRALDSILESALDSADVRDLAGEPQDLLGYLPDHASVVGRALASVAAGDADESDADSVGNLKGFVAEDDEVDFDSDFSGNDDADDDDDSVGGSGSKDDDRLRRSSDASKVASATKNITSASPTKRLRRGSDIISRQINGIDECADSKRKRPRPPLSSPGSRYMETGLAHR